MMWWYHDDAVDGEDVVKVGDEIGLAGWRVWVHA